MLYFSQTVNAEKFANPQWIVTSLPGGRQLLVLSGVVIIDFWSRQPSWHRDSVTIYPDKDLQSVIASAGLPPAPQGLRNQISGGTICNLRGMSSIFDQDTAVKRRVRGRRILTSLTLVGC